MEHHFALFSMTLSLFLLMDPIGNIPLYVSLLKDLPKKRQIVVIIREMIIALVVIFLFTFFGEYLLRWLGIDQQTVSIAGGFILLVIALRMIFPPEKEQSVSKKKEEPFIVPLAIPFVAGPAILAAVMIYSHKAPSIPLLLLAIVIAWFCTTIILVSSPFLKKILGKRGVIACERLMGLVLSLIGVQMVLEGIRPFFLLSLA